VLGGKVPIARPLPEDEIVRVTESLGSEKLGSDERGDDR
jgi:hypothetical protein